MTERWRVRRQGAWIARSPEGLGTSFYTWQAAFEYADAHARYAALERQYLDAVAESRGSGRRGPEGWRS